MRKLLKETPWNLLHKKTSWGKSLRKRKFNLFKYFSKKPTLSYLSTKVKYTKDYKKYCTEKNNLKKRLKLLSQNLKNLTSRNKPNLFFNDTYNYKDYRVFYF